MLIDADTIRRGEGGGRNGKIKNPTRRDIKKSRMDKEKQQGLLLPRGLSLFGQRPRRGPQGTLVLYNRGNFVRTSVCPLIHPPPVRALRASSRASLACSQTSEASNKAFETTN